MKKSLLVTTASLSLIASTSILANTLKPITCPSISAIQSVKFDMAREVNGLWGAGVTRNRFGTDFAWSFRIEGISAKDADYAISIGNEAVKTLSFIGGPFHANPGGYPIDYCSYTTAKGYEATAYASDITPPYPMPAACPSVKAIQSVEIDKAFVIGPKFGAGILRNKFNTDINWFFYIYDIPAKDSTEAINIGRGAVKSLRFVRGPYRDEDNAMYDCEYITDEGYASFAYST